MDITFMSGEDERYPKELLKNRHIIEGNFLGLLWRKITLLDNYNHLKDKDFITTDGRFYFCMMKEMRKMGFNTIDEINLLTYFGVKDAIVKKLFDDKGGYRALTSFAVLLNEDNIDKYYDDIIKYNILMILHDKKFDVMSNLDTFIMGDSNSVYNYFDGILNTIFVHKTLDLETADLTTGYDKFIEKADSGQNMGISYAKASPILNYQTAGVRKGCTIVASTTSGGKSSWLAKQYILDFIEQGHKVILIINEEEEEAWRSLLLTTVINYKLWDRSGFTRKRFLEGHFTEAEHELIKKAVIWLEQYAGSIEFVKCFDYRIDTVKMIVGKYSKLGYDVVILDTFKAPDNGGSDNNPAWKQMVEASKALFQACMKAGMYLIVTAQVALRYNNIRKLGCEHLGGATAISEIADTVIIFRDAWADEIDMGNNKYINPYNFIRKEDGTYSSSVQKIELDPKEQYAIAFLAKVRGGARGTELVYKKNIAFNNWKELGYCTVSQY
jgi:hypothetical protein